MRANLDKWPKGKNGELIPPDDPTDDERYVLNHWAEWILGSFVPHWSTVAHFLVPRSPKTESYDLFDRAPGLFRKFADTPQTIDGVIAFADEYGQLGGDGSWPELVEDWIRDIRAMRRAVDAWDSATENLGYKKVVGLINRRGQRGRISNEAGTGTNFLLEVDASGEPRLCIRPRRLLDALWTQLTMAVVGKQNLQRCAVCSTWFPVEAARSDKEYCSRACQMRAYRKRKGVE
jgi:hypothetical protein